VHGQEKGKIYSMHTQNKQTSDGAFTSILNSQ